MPQSNLTRVDKVASRLDVRASKPHQQKRREHPQHGADRAAKNTANQVKTRLRSVRRLLENKSESMPPDQRIALEREQAALQHDLQESLERAKKRKLVSKYHMVRFFGRLCPRDLRADHVGLPLTVPERRKAERALKRARKSAKEMDETIDTHESSAEELHRREVDLNYTMYYPLSEAYVSLYPKDNSSMLGPNRSCPVWEEVESAMTKGTLHDLRDRSGTVTSMIQTSRRQAEQPGARCGAYRAGSSKLEREGVQRLGIAKTTKPSKMNTQDNNDEENDGESNDDGAGFFE